MRRTRVLLVVLVLVSVAAIAAWRWLAPPEVELVRPGRGPAVEAVHATGLVEPSLEIRIAPRAAGRLVELEADEGDTVRKGDLLARLEDADLQASVAELEARVGYAQAQYERNLKLQSANLVSQEAVDRTRAELDATRATLRRARDQLSFMRLTAPSDGRIIRRDGEIGEFIPVNQTVFYMAGPAPLRVTAEIDEEDVPRVRPGQPVLIRSDAFPGRIFDGTVDQVTPRGDPVARSYRVRIALPQDQGLRIGMTAETNIIVERRDDALLVPTGAVRDGQVWVVAGDRVERRAVTTGVTGEERTEIREGLSGGEWIVARPTGRLSPGGRVRVRGRDAGAASPARP
jgi:RND family efflux transporter MFP subunit